MWGPQASRFSLLLLEEGEQYLHDWTATADWPDGFLQSGAGSVEPGRIRLCTKSIFFQPDQIKLPVIRIPFSHVQELQFTDDATFQIISTLLITMRPNNLDVPYTNHKALSQWTFGLPYTPVEEFMVQAQRQLALSHLPPGEREDLLQAEKFLQADATEFDISRLVDFSEEILSQEPAVLLSPLTLSPGRLVISPQRLYFQPKHDVSGQHPCYTHPLSLVAAVARRRAILRPTGLEIFFADSSANESSEGPFWDAPSAFFTFENQASRDNVLSALKQQDMLASSLPGGSQASQACPYILEAETEWLPRVKGRWQAGHISNFAYLLYLNLAAGRSLNDLSQWPVFPWVLSDYRRQTLDLADHSMFRDLSKPIGALSPKRHAMLTQRYMEMPREPGCDPPFMYGTHYSCPGYIMFYLVRAAPGHLLRLQNGRYDSPDRMFCDIGEAWDSVAKNPTDLKELIPDFFLNDTRFLQNLDALPLGTRQNGRPVGDVKLPSWASSPADFLRKHRAALECPHVSAHLHEWIDLIFGYKQQGAEAEKAGNVFRHLTYEGAVDLDSITSLLERQAVETQISEFGQCPAQLFQTAHPPRFQTALTSGDSLPEMKQNAPETLSSALIATILAAASTPAPAEADPVPEESAPCSSASSPSHQPSGHTTVGPPALSERSAGSWTSKLQSARRWSGQLTGQLGSLMDGIAQKGEKAGLSPDALKGMFQRSAAQQSPQPAARKTLLSTAASSQQQSASTSVPSLSTPLGAGTRPQAPAVSLPCGAPGSWGSDLLDRLRSLPALPTQEDSINGLCIDLIGGMPAQIYALDSGNMKAWSLLDGKQLRSLQLGNVPLTCLAVPPRDGSLSSLSGLAFAGSQSSQVHVANISTSSPDGSFHAHHDTVSCLDFLPDSLVTGSWDCSVKVWRIEEGRQPWSSAFPVPVADLDEHETGIWAIACDPAHKGIFCGTEEGMVTYWDTRLNKAAWQVKSSTDYVGDISISPDGEHISIAAASSGLIWLDKRKFSCPVAVLGCSAPVRCCATDGRAVLAALENGQVKFWLPAQNVSCSGPVPGATLQGCPMRLAARQLPGQTFVVIGTDVGTSAAWATPTGA